MVKQQPRLVNLTDTIVVAGRVDGSTVAVLRETLHAAVDRGTGPIVIDVSGVDTIDATGLGMLIGTQRRAGARGSDIVLRNVPDRMARMLKATRLDRVLRSEASLAVRTG